MIHVNVAFTPSLENLLAHTPLLRFFVVSFRSRKQNGIWLFDEHKMMAPVEAGGGYMYLTST